MAETNRKHLIVIWVLRAILGVAFLTIGAAKLTGTVHTVETFEAFGWGQWFRYLTGLLDTLGAALLFVPRGTFYGALLLACTIGLGTVLSFLHLHDSLATPLALTLMAATLAWLTWKRRNLERADEQQYRESRDSATHIEA